MRSTSSDMSIFTSKYLGVERAVSLEKLVRTRLNVAGFHAFQTPRIGIEDHLELLQPIGHPQAVNAGKGGCLIGPTLAEIEGLTEIPVQAADLVPGFLDDLLWSWERSIFALKREVLKNSADGLFRYVFLHYPSNQVEFICISFGTNRFGEDREPLYYVFFASRFKFFFKHRHISRQSIIR